MSAVENLNSKWLLDSAGHRFLSDLSVHEVSLASVVSTLRLQSHVRKQLVRFQKDTRT